MSTITNPWYSFRSLYVGARQSLWRSDSDMPALVRIEGASDGNDEFAVISKPLDLIHVGDLSPATTARIFDGAINEVVDRVCHSMLRKGIAKNVTKIGNARGC